MVPEQILDWDWISQHQSSSWVPWVCRSLDSRRGSEGDAILVSNATSQMTVDEFAQRAASVAVRLSNENAHDVVLIYVDRSPAAAAAMIGVRWSGRCVVPVSVDDPPARVAEIASRLGSCSIVDPAGAAPRMVGDRPVVTLVDVRADWMDPASVIGSSPALIVFTSGSTGRPKGVVRTSWQDDYSGLRECSFDPSSWRSAVHSPLQWLGGYAVLRRSMASGSAHFIDLTRVSPHEIVNEWQRTESDKISLTPSLLDSIARATSTQLRCESIKWINLVGEPVRWATVESGRPICAKDAVIWCTYGGSEALSTLFRNPIRPEQDIGEGFVPLGNPTGDHIQLEACDSGDDSVREIVVHRWVSRGYWDDADLQSRQFGTNARGEPIWRSGDLVSVDADGLVHFKGRVDDMVKISGKLVEPAESAKALETCPGIRRSIVLPRAMSNGRTQLVAHVEASGDTTVERVRSHLVRRLPPHLIPAVIVKHESLPVTERGKVDRQGLSNAPIMAWRSKPPAMPHSPFETRVLADISQFLGVDSLGMDDDLWLYGLDSLGAIELSEILARLAHTGLTASDFLGASTPRTIV